MYFKFDFNDIDLSFGACIIPEHLILCIQEKNVSILSFKGEVCMLEYMTLNKRGGEGELFKRDFLKLFRV